MIFGDNGGGHFVFQGSQLWHLDDFGSGMLREDESTIKHRSSIKTPSPRIGVCHLDYTGDI